MTEAEFKDRLKQFALRVMRVGDTLPGKRSADILGRQLIRCGTSVGANYRAACRAKSPADFVAKLAIAEEEADETGYWLGLIAESGLMAADRLDSLRRETDELLAILVASIKTARGRLSGHGQGHRAPANPKSKIQNPKSPGGPA